MGGRGSERKEEVGAGTVGACWWARAEEGEDKDDEEEGLVVGLGVVVVVGAGVVVAGAGELSLLPPSPK